MVINTNVNALIGLNNMRSTSNSMSGTLQRLSSGLKINIAADDPSGLAIAKGMEAQLGGISVAIQNAEDGISLIHTADGALAETQNILLRMRDLAVRAANEATLTDADVTRLNNEFTSLKEEIQRKSNAVTFNTKTLFSGMFSAGLQLQIGADNKTTMQLAIQISCMGVSALGLSVDGDPLTVIGLSNGYLGAATAMSAAGAAISAVQAALNKISDVRATLGIQERRLNYAINDLSAESINIAAAKSRIIDADMASEISEYTKLQILQQSGMAILAQANSQPQNVLSLLQ